MGQLAVVSTESVKQGELNDVWKNWLSSYVARKPDEANFTGVTFVPDDVGGFKGCIEYGDLGDSGICRVVSSSYRYIRNRQQASESGTTTMVVLQTRGKSCFEQAGRKTSLFPGDWNIYDPSRPFSVTSTGQSENLVLLLPESTPSDLRDMLDRMPGRSFGRNGIECTVRELISVSFRESQKMSYRSGATVTGSIVQMIHSSVEEAVKNYSSSVFDLKSQIVDFIRANLVEEDLGVGRIAEAFGCSTRQVHRLFQVEAGISVSEYIWTSRLEHSLENLRNHELRERTITEIAFNSGFNNAAHFSRLFKEKYGITPRECRSAQSR